MRRRVARSRPLRAFAVGVAIAVVLPWAATAGVEDYGSSRVMTFGDPALSATDEPDASPAAGGVSSAIFMSEGALEAGDCTYAAGTVSLQVTVQRTLYVAHGEINSDEGPCGEATVANTDEVVVTGGSDDDALVLDLEEPFAPGATPEDSGAEIELDIDLGGGNNVLIISGSSAVDELVAGADGINLNPEDETALPDADIATGSIGRLELFGNSGADRISGGGGEGTGVAVNAPLLLSGHDGDDDLTGGDGTDALLGGAGNDDLNGGIGEDTADFSGTDVELAVDLSAGRSTGAGNDSLDAIENVTGGNSDDVLAGDSGSNVLEGGLGVDTADYSAAVGSIEVDLSAGKASGEGGDTLGGIENVTGGDGDDVLTGDSGPNVLEGGAGVDSVFGGEGDDELRMRDEAAEIDIVCGDGDDRAVTDARDVDEPAADCESVDATLPELSIDDVTVDEGDTGTALATFEVVLTQASSEDVLVSYTLLGVTATESDDYLDQSGEVVIPEGELSAPVAIEVVGDRVDEGFETFRVDLSHPTNAVGEPSAFGTISDDDDSPVLPGQSVSTAEDTAKAITLGPADGDGDALSYEVVELPEHGALSAIAGDEVTYTPQANYSGGDNFTVRASDGVNDSGAAAVTITVTEVDDAPVAPADSYSTAESTALTVPARGVLSNDTDVDTPVLELTAAKVSDPSHGTVTVNANGSITYTPNTGSNGLDSFTYEANDGALDSNVSTVTITVTPVDDAPPPPPPPPPPPAPPSAKPRHGLTVAKSGTGIGTVQSLPGISCGADCIEEYEAGTAVTLTAVAGRGSRFGSWRGACSGSSATCTVAMDAAKAVTATFTKTVLRTPKFKPVKVCHKGRTITVRSKKALKQHLKHGDKRGACKPKKKRRN